MPRTTTARALSRLLAPRTRRGAGCPHPPSRLWAWESRDDTAPGGTALCVACCACGAVLAGGAKEGSKQ